MLDLNQIRAELLQVFGPRWTVAVQRRHQLSMIPVDPDDIENMPFIDVHTNPKGFEVSGFSDIIEPLIPALEREFGKHSWSINASMQMYYARFTCS